MANHLLNNPSGIDFEIQRIQTYVFNKLTNLWNDIEVFGRIYKNKVNNGYVAQYYLGGTNKDYLKDVYLNDDKIAHVFFITSDESKTKDGILFTNEVKVVCMVNLEKITNTQSNRIDSYAQSILYKQVKSQRKISITGIETGLETVMRGFSLDNLKKANLQPYHIFAIRGSLNFYLNNNCNV